MLKPDVKMYRYAKLDLVQELRASDQDLPDLFLEKPFNHFAYQCLNNVQMYKYATFDQNLWCGSKVMSIFTKKKLDQPK